ncbi:MAG TPA: hypothetical protein PLF79_03350 [Thauera sp.]|uniref:hypothetical protein n=1 Tax=Thauera sp. TaxID=1905334 RepID=UPI002C7CAD49|nr:hypothetical protein [Thauera sp.]HRP24775.1 hypothetical protein [Thauera sp.]HRP65078.1 hypothetical protein [Thauera sp.]
MDGWLVAFEALALAQALSASSWLYPLVNAGHILGIALLVGAIVPLDLRLLGLWRRHAVLPLWAVLGSCAAWGLGLAAVCGGLLFITRASEYAASPLFLAKMGVVALGLVNALALRVRAADPAAWAGAVPLHARLAAAVSLIAWLTALLLGRWIGYR